MVLLSVSVTRPVIKFCSGMLNSHCCYTNECRTWTRLLDSPFSCCAHVAVQMVRMGSDNYDIVTFGGWNGGSTFNSEIWEVHTSPQDRR